MNEPDRRRRDSERDSRRRETPDHRVSRTASRSRSRVRTRSPSRAERDRERERGRERVELLERELQRERERLRVPERHHRPSSRQASELREGSRARHDVRRESHPEPRVDAGEQRSRSPSLSKKDFADIIKCLRDGFSSHSTQSAQTSQKIDFKNILPSFDPSSKTQRIDVWLKKVNECASVYGWDDKTTTHFAMQKLQGLARTWYEGLNSILFSWKEWEEKLVSAFPFDQNYGQALEEMLRRKSKFNEAIEVYYYEKLTLLNRCDIVGKRAVDCIIHGISDRTIKSGALALRCLHPDQLLQYLASNKDSNQSLVDRNLFKSKTSDSVANSSSKPKVGFRQPSAGCYNCKEKGHSFLHCPKPLLKCSKCSKIGHTSDNCFVKSNDPAKVKSPGVQKTMCIDSDGNQSGSSPSSKFTKEVRVNGIAFKAFVDFGSDVTLIKESVTRSLGLDYNRVSSAMKGFGNEVVHSLGELSLDLCIDDVRANVVCKVVNDELLDKPVLIGQSFTEQSHIIAYKNVAKLQFLDIGSELPQPDIDSAGECSFKVRSAGVLQLYGAATVRAQIEHSFNGSVLIKNSIAGEPNNQYFVVGGLYYAKCGRVDVAVTPCSMSCLIPKDSVFCRADKVNFINRVVVESHLDTSAIGNFDESQVRIGDGVSELDKQRLLDLLKKYQHCFASSLKELGCTNKTEMHIELNSTRPVVYRPYRLSHHERGKVRSMVEEMLDAGVVKESLSEYASPILLVRKKDGSMRMCVDYRMLNSVTVKERYPMPVIEDEIARLTGQACFITLDLASGYYQVPISEQSKHLTAFITPDGHYEFNRMPFGLANAPAVFQRMMNALLGSARFGKATAYIDDVLIFGRNPAECLERLEEVLQVLGHANLTLNLAKCDFLCDKISYLGYEISAAGVRPGEGKIVSVQNFPRPENVHNVRQFLGLASYFRKFIRDFALISCPLTKLLKKGAAWEWGDSQEQSFVDLKSRLIDRPILAIYDPAAETELHTDASRIGIGGILLQRKSASEPFHPVAYYSRQTSPEEKNFHSYELETLAVVFSLRKFRVYLIGKEFKIVTDCSALRSTFLKRDLIPRIARWWLTLQEFDCSIEYRAGSKMSHVDALSRNPVVDDGDVLVEQFPSVMSITNDDWLHTLQLGDSELSRIKSILGSDLDEKGLEYIRENYVIKDDKLFRCLDGDKDRIRWVVPKGARWQLCRMNHDDIGHFGYEKTLEKIKKNYWFAKMPKFVKKYVNACIECAFAKKNSNDREGLLHPIAKVEVPFHTLHVDHLGPFVKSSRGHTHLLVVVDAFTKFCFVKPVRNTNTQNVVRVLAEIFYTFRIPDRLISDRGSCFTSHAFKRFALDKGFKHILNAVASPRSNGQVERYNRTILDSLKTFSVKHGEKDWDNHLGKVQWGLNNTIQKTTGRTPAEVLFGTAMNVGISPILNEIVEETRENSDRSVIRNEVKKKIDREQVKQKERYDEGRKPAREYELGALVKITKTCFNNDGQSKKLMATYVGPYRVTKVLGRDRYKVAPVPGLGCTQNKRETTVSADRMRPWIHIAALEVNDNDSVASSADQSDCD